MKKAIGIALLLLLVGVTAGYAKTKSIAKDNVNVRAKPSRQAPILFVAPKGYPLWVRQQQKNWVQVEDWQGKRGWVYRPLISAIPTAVVQVETANVRKSPNRRASRVTQAKHGEIYRVFASQGDWVKIGYYFENEKLGWIHRDLVWGY